MASPIISKKNAAHAGLIRYFTGKPCTVGHVAERYVSNGTCLECARDKDRQAKRKRYFQQYDKCEARRAYFARYRQEHAEEIRAYAEEYREKHADRIQEQTKRWKAKHPEHISRQTDARRRRLLRSAARPRPERCEGCEIKTKYLCFDHDHETGMFRSWLCQQCNTILGMARDNPETLRRLTAILEQK